MHIVHTNKYSSIFLGHAYNCYTREGTIDRGDQTSKNYDCQNFRQLFTGGPVHIKHVFTGVPEISNEFSRESTESPSLKRSTRKSGRSRDSIFSRLIFYGVATISKLLKMIVLFCKRAL